MARPTKQHLTRRADGRYRCTYKGVQFMGATEQEALAKREQYIRQAERGLTQRAPTVGDFAQIWLPLYKGGVSVRTYNDYASQLDALVRQIGSKRIPDVTVTDAKRVYAHFAGYSQSTIHRARMLYISLFDTAVEEGHCQRNVFRSKHAQPDKGSSGTHRIITQEERDLILTTEHRMRLAAMVMLYAGLRRGEAAAILIERDVDFAHGVIHVTQSARYEGNTPTIAQTKTAAGRRDVPLLPILADALRGQSGWLVHSVDGAQATGTAYARGWQSYMSALTRAAGHPISIRCHDLRHSYCTMLRDAGVEMHLAMTWLGHADEKMILRVYDHISEDRVQENTQRVVARLETMQNQMQIAP